MPKEKATMWKEAETIANAFLDTNGFCGEGLYGSGKADWFAIGGRWSGEFMTLQGWYPKVMEKIHAMLKEKYPTLDSGVQGVWYGDKEKDQQKVLAIAEIKKMWEKLAPLSWKDTPCPEIRDSLYSASVAMGDKHHEGYVSSEQDDNAMIMTPTMFKRLRDRYKPKKDDWGSVEIVDTTDSVEYTLTDIPKEKVIGNWVVVIDYHN